MFTVHSVRHLEQTHHRDEWLHWMIAIVLGMILAALLLTRLAVAKPGVAPQLLSPRAVEQAAPMGEDAWAAEDITPLPAELAAQLRQAMRQHEVIRFEQAAQQWQAIRLPGDLQVWREVGLAAAQLELREVGDATVTLDRAAMLWPDHPLVHYYRAMLRLTQAEAARDWNDAIGEPTVKLVAWRPKAELQFTKSMYRMMAQRELETVLETAANVNECQSLIGLDEMPGGGNPPTVGDLLQAIGAEHFQANTHGMLGELCLQAGQLQQAEQHMDAAHTLGLYDIYGYRDLAAEYQRDHRYADAARAYGKALRLGEDQAELARHVLENTFRFWLNK